MGGGRRRTRKQQHEAFQKRVEKYFSCNVKSEVIMQDKPQNEGGLEVSSELNPIASSPKLITTDVEDQIEPGSQNHPLKQSYSSNSTDCNGVCALETKNIKDRSATKSESAFQSKQVIDSNSLNLKDDETLENNKQSSITKSQTMCNYCALTFQSESDLNVHCQTEAHQIVVMSDGGRDWKHRPPPRGLMADGYTLCENWDKNCRYGLQCVEAHSAEELEEWCKRFEYRQKKIQQAEQQNLLGKSYTEHLLEKWSQTSNPDSVLKENVDYVEDSVSENQLTTTVSKDCKTDWTFLIKTSKLLRAIAFLQYPDRHRFSVKSVKSIVGGQPTQWVPQNSQEWILPEEELKYFESLQQHKSNMEFRHSVCVEFFSDIFGTFRQTVAFDFGLEPLMVKHLCVDVRPASFASNVEELKKELFMEERWDENNAVIHKFSSPNEGPVHPVLNKPEELLGLYPTPTPSTFTLTQSTVTERMITKNNYCSRMHELLGVEEMARYQQVARYNVRSKLNITKSYLLAPAGTAFSSAKYAQNDQLYAVMHLSQAISEDTAAGRLILNNCTSVLLCAADEPAKDSSKKNVNAMETSAKRKVFEALIEDKGKNVIYLKLSSETVKEYNIEGGMVFYAEVQFQLNRLQYCEWHRAVDSIKDYKILFPETFLEPDIPWTPQRQWKELKETKLNVKQKEAIVAITTPLSIKLPPVLIIGPFGTGKTYTLAQAIKQLLAVPDTRILVCTHSNSAADIYVHDYLHPYVESGHKAARPLRIYYHKRWVSTVHPIVQKYCLINNDNGIKSFRVPNIEDVVKHRVIVVTLSISMDLASLGLEDGFFTHILLDEAAQTMECEAIMPLALAGENTRLVLAGDHMQLNPELFSPFAKERNLHMSLLERLYDHYPTSFPCKILLTENYRAHEAIIKFTSDLFYDQKLISGGRQPSHSRFYPLTFFSCRGEDVQEINSTGHYNLAEVYEIAERVIELRKCWPSEWGELNDQSIGIMTPYADQVFRIRCELRRKSLGGISVERVLNVQGKQFRAIFISTVRTRRTCSSGTKGSGNEETEYGFLSNSKLLNTAITRAQSLVAVVGDPIALCSLGRCRKVWESYIKTCDDHNSLFGMPWSTIQAHLDGVEFKPTYVLNPLAPEFIPMSVARPHYRGNSSSYNPCGNDALVLNGYHSHLAFFDQTSPSHVQRPIPYQQHVYGPGPSHLEGPIYQNVFLAPHVHQHPHRPHHPHLYGVHHPHAQPWPVQQEQIRPGVAHAHMPYLMGTCGLQAVPDLIPSSACGPQSSIPLLPQAQRLWPNSNHQNNTVTHVIPEGIATSSSVNAKAYEGNKLVLPGTLDVPNADLMAINKRVNKVNGNLMLNSGVPGFNPSHIAAGAFQTLPNNAVAHLECQPFLPQPVQQLHHHQAYIPNRQGQCQYAPQPQQSLHQQALLQQLTQQVQPHGMPAPRITNTPFHQLMPNPVVQQQIVQNPQLHQLPMQSPPIQQHQISTQLIQYQQSPMQTYMHEHQLRDIENQLRLKQEQHRQQQHQLAMLQEQRKMLLGHILTPLVHCKPEWNKLIPKGVNLLDMVDNKSQQVEWFNHLIQHGQEDLAKKFEEFMGLCIRTISSASSEPKQIAARPPEKKIETPDQNGALTPNSEENSGVVALVANGHGSNTHSGPSSSRSSSEEGRTSARSANEPVDGVIMMKDLDPTYMLGSDPFLNGGKSVWAIAQDELEHCSRNGSRLKCKSLQKSVQKSETFDSDDSGDELLSSIKRQLDLQQSVED